MRSAETEPVVAATALNASALPAAFVSTFASVAALPTRIDSPGGGGGGVAVTVPAAQAERLPSVKEAPLVEGAGIAVRPLVELTSELTTRTAPCLRKRSVPTDPRMAIP